MAYFSYHNIAKKLINSGKLKCFYYTERYKNICPALVLIFDDIVHPVMPIRKEHWEEYFSLLIPYQYLEKLFD
ncbi:MAG: thermostable hemolysin delta-VPH [Oscillospiraceae bacterium]